VQRPEVVLERDITRAAIATGMVDLIVPLDQIAERLARFASHRVSDPAAPDDAERQVGEAPADVLRDVLALVRIRSGHDFASYKRATLYRRLSRRMQVSGCDSIASYYYFLRDHPAELAHLLRDFLISVTNFFRDRDAFDALSAAVPQLFAGKGPGDQVRVWVAGCATGEEAYSIGMLLLQHARQLAAPPQLQIFATDIDDHALAEARAGRYPRTIAADVSPDQLAQFFQPDGESYRVAEPLREIVLFSPHNLLRDPPFSRLDLISCRNLLIYLNREAQARVLNTFHFALRTDGLLFLGSSETAESSDLFGSVDAKQRLYRWRPNPTRLISDAIVTAGRWQPPSMPATPPRPEERMTVGELHHLAVEQFAPPSVLVNDDLDIVHLSARAGSLFRVSGGAPSRQLLQLIHPALKSELRTAIYAARQSPRGQDARVLRFDDAGTPRAIELRVRTVDRPELGAGALLLLFDEIEPAPAAAPAGGGDALEPMVRALEDELGRTRDQLRTTIEQYETSLEELKASNEELQAINEELRSATEELETSKEELQSVNEELTTLNHELKLKVDEVSHANGDLQNLMMSTDIGVVFLDRALHLKRFTPRAQDLFNVIASDVGRPFAHVTHRLRTDELPQLAQGVLQTLRSAERELATRDGRRYLARLLPYRSLEDRIEGVVLTFVDVSDLRNAVDARERSELARVESDARLRFALRDTVVLAVTLDADLRTTWGYVLGREVAAGSSAFQDLFAPDQAARFEAVARRVLASDERHRLELELLVDGARRTYDFRIEGHHDGISAVGFDVSASKVAEASQRDADHRKDEFIATLSRELRDPLMPLTIALDVARLAGGDPAVLAKSHATMAHQIGQLGQLVDDLLDLTSLSLDKLPLERVLVDPVQVVDAALEIARVLLHERHHRVEVTRPDRAVRVLGDRARLTQIVVNLLTNAARYTPDGGRIAVALDVAGARLRIRVRDNGQGIAPDMIDRVFEMFLHGRDEAGRARGGVGIGLNLVRRLTELHGGTVAVASEGPGRGSEFTVELPLAEP
jgi:two-component system CheB/CheR fusion protein